VPPPISIWILTAEHQYPRGRARTFASTSAIELSRSFRSRRFIASAAYFLFPIEAGPQYLSYVRMAAVKLAVTLSCAVGSLWPNTTTPIAHKAKTATLMGRNFFVSSSCWGLGGCPWPEGREGREGRDRVSPLNTISALCLPIIQIAKGARVRVRV
jgi:hypothetical protein